MLNRIALALVVGAAQLCAAQQPLPAPSPAPRPPAVSAPEASRMRDARPDSLRWMQSAAEYRMITTEAYRLARYDLDRALRDRRWTAATEQAGNFRALKPAIILDIDETVLDNSTFQAEQAASAAPFTTAAFNAWVERRAAIAIPGVVDFLRYARQRGVEVFFVSNRDAAGKQATIANLQKVGIPTDAGHVLLVHEQGWNTADKSPRRAFVAAHHRVVLLFGDDLNDFVTVLGRSSRDRYADACAHHNWWGTRWVILPNAMYGSWDSAARRAPNERICETCNCAAQ